MVEFAKQIGGFWREYFSYSWDDLVLTAGTGTAFEDTVVHTDSDSDFELHNLIHQATDNRILVRMLDETYGRFLHNNTPIDLRELSGTSVSSITPSGFLPKRLPYPHIIAGGSNFTFSFADASGLTNLIRLTGHGAKIREGNAPWTGEWEKIIPFHAVETATVTADTSRTVNIPIGTDAHFVVMELGVVRTGPALVRILDSSTDREWMNTGVHIDNLFGNSQYPNKLPAYRFMYRGGVISMTVEDISGSNNTIRFLFSGVKLYGRSILDERIKG